MTPQMTDKEFRTALHRLRDVLDVVRVGSPPTSLDLCQFFNSRVCTDRYDTPRPGRCDVPLPGRIDSLEGLGRTIKTLQEFHDYLMEKTS